MNDNSAALPRIDLKVSPQDTSWDDFLQTCCSAEESGAFEGLWFFDHLAPVASGSPRPLDADSTCLEGWTTLAAVAASTTRVRLGLLVSAVPYRPVMLLAKMASNVDHISGGRLELGLGAGNTHDEATRFGIPFGTVKERMDALEQACIDLRRMLQREHAEPGDVSLQPPPIQAHVPIVVGGKGEKRTLPMIARYADGWNYSRGTPEEFAAKKSVLAEMCGRAGRSISDVSCSVQVRVDHRAPGDGADLATDYAAAGADQIVLYTQAIPEAVEVLADTANTLRRA